MAMSELFRKLRKQLMRMRSTKLVQNTDKCSSVTEISFSGKFANRQWLSCVSSDCVDIWYAGTL